MRKVAIIYNADTDSEIAEKIYNSLNAYDVIRFPLDEEHTIEEAYVSWGDIPNLIITVNLAGFGYRSSGNNNIYATLPVNTLHYIDKDLEDEEKLLQGLIPITMKFVVDDEERGQRLKKAYRRIYDLDIVTDIENQIPELLENMDWRKR